MSRVFCAAPFVHMYVTPGEENERVCCQAIPYTKKPVWDLEKRWSGDELQRIREDMLVSPEKPTDRIEKMCMRCIDQEASGDISDRNRYNDNYKDIDFNIELGNTFETPIDLDLRPGNLCNLQCRMCFSGASSQIEKEIQNADTPQPLWFMGPKNVTIADWSTNGNLDFLFKNVNHYRRLKFLGGEPTIMPEVHNILDMLIENNITNVPISITTNLTNVNKKFMQKLEKFSCISINYSIDGTGKTVEYVRYPVNWEKIKKNILEYEKIAMSSMINYTVQAYNIHNMKEFVEWANSINVRINFNMVTQPEWDSVYVLPPEYREKCLSNININTAKHILNNDKKYSIMNYRNFVRHTKLLDMSRKHHIKDYIPELWELIKEDYDAIQI
jgi:sulfatase maturation enzyme AslB (radical SAM superfamily)